MKDEDLFSHKEASPTTSNQEPRGESEHYAHSPASPVSQEALPLAHIPKTQRRFSPRHHLWLLLVVALVVVLVVLAGGYAIFRTVSPGSVARMARIR